MCRDWNVGHGPTRERSSPAMAEDPVTSRKPSTDYEPPTEQYGIAEGHIDADDLSHIVEENTKWRRNMIDYLEQEKLKAVQREHDLGLRGRDVAAGDPVPDRAGYALQIAEPDLNRHVNMMPVEKSHTRPVEVRLNDLKVVTSPSLIVTTELARIETKW